MKVNLCLYFFLGIFLFYLQAPVFAADDEEILKYLDLLEHYDVLTDEDYQELLQDDKLDIDEEKNSEN